MSLAVVLISPFKLDVLIIAVPPSTWLFTAYFFFCALSSINNRVCTDSQILEKVQNKML